MQLIKLDATDSTNAHLKRLTAAMVLGDYTVVSTRSQTQGRGQMGTTWQSEDGKNLTFSVLRADLNWPVDQGFVLNLCVSMAVFSVLDELKVPDLSIKWPNDILSGSSKLCGILIENKLTGNTINTSIIGIGLNVNQTVYAKELPNASSLKLLLGRAFDLDGMLQRIVEELKSIFRRMEADGPDILWNAYERHLFRKGMLSTFADAEDKLLRGRIKGVSRDGKLIVATVDAGKKEFGLKEVKLLI